MSQAAQRRSTQQRNGQRRSGGSDSEGHITITSSNAAAPNIQRHHYVTDNARADEEEHLAGEERNGREDEAEEHPAGQQRDEREERGDGGGDGGALRISLAKKG